MQERHETFPSALEAFFVVIGLFAVERFLGAPFETTGAAFGIDPRDFEGVIVLLGNAAVFAALMHYKQLSYRSLFHPSRNSVAATLGTLAIPVLLLMPALALGMWALMSMVQWAIPMSRWQEAMFERMMSNGLASVISVCLLAPVLEEMLFRGIILRSFLLQYGKWTAILGSAAIFGFFHLNVYQFFVGLVLGTLGGWLYERSRSLWPCILLHGSYNSIITAAYYSGSASGEDAIWDLSPFTWALCFVMAWAGSTMLRRLLVPVDDGK